MSDEEVVVVTDAIPPPHQPEPSLCSRCACELENDELGKKATAAGLPPQIYEFLVNSGYQTVATVARLQDIKAAEAFFRENYEVFENNPKRECLYGLFAQTPHKFTLLPGHLQILSAFIQECKKDVPDCATHNGTETTAAAEGGDTKTRKRFKASRKVIPPRFLSHQRGSQQRRPLITSPRRRLSQHATLSGGGHQASSTEPIIIDGGQEGDVEGLPVDDPSRLVEDTYADIVSKLGGWCLNQKIKEIQELKYCEQYKVVVQVDDTTSDGSGLYVCMICLMCTTIVRLHIRKNSFAISNATRHLANCALKPDLKPGLRATALKRKRQRPRLKTLQPAAENQEHQAEDGDGKPAEENMNVANVVDDHIYVFTSPQGLFQ